MVTNIDLKKGRTFFHKNKKKTFNLDSITNGEYLFLRGGRDPDRVECNKKLASMMFIEVVK